MRQKIAEWLRSLADALSPLADKNTLEVTLTCDTSQFDKALKDATASLRTFAVHSKRAGIRVVGSLKK